MALVDTQNPGNGILVDASTVGRAVGDTSSGAIFVSELPKNFQGGDEALHFALGELFGAYGKIKKIELYMEKGILETENFKGEALIVYHPSKFTGTHDKGDPVYEACTEMDGKYRVLGHRNWRVRCEAAQWQKEGFNVKERAKKFPCVEIGNLWDYNPSMSMGWFLEVQEAIRNHATEHVQQPFVKVEPSEGTATVWCRGAQDAMKFASIMQKSYFMGRKVVAALCRKEKPAMEALPKVPKGELTMKLPGQVIPVGDLPAGPIDPALAAAIRKAAAEQQAAEVAAARRDTEEEEVVAVAGPAFLLREGCHVILKGLVSKPENNGRKATIVSYVEDAQKYQVRLDDGRFVKVKPENVEAVPEPAPKSVPQALRPDDDEDDDDDDGANAQAMASEMARGNVPHGPEKLDGKDGFTATVCVDPSLLPKRENEKEEETQEQRRDRSRSRERRRLEQIESVKARLAADKGPRPGWVVSGPAPGAVATAATDDAKKEPEQSREELMKLPVSKLKQLLSEFGKSARGCIEKKDFVDRLKPPPKS